MEHGYGSLVQPDPFDGCRICAYASTHNTCKFGSESSTRIHSISDMTSVYLCVCVCDVFEQDDGDDIDEYRESTHLACALTIDMIPWQTWLERVINSRSHMLLPLIRLVLEYIPDNNA
jgi:hypothetical protein